MTRVIFRASRNPISVRLLDTYSGKTHSVASDCFVAETKPLLWVPVEVGVEVTSLA